MKTHAIELFENIIKHLKQTKDFDEESFHTLHSFFGNLLFESIHITESAAVTKICSESGRSIYNVSDHCLYPVDKPDEYKRDVFFCTAEPRYCSCTFFLDKVVCDSEALVCRHALAVVLSEVFDSCQLQRMDDESFAEEYYKYGIN